MGAMVIPTSAIGRVGMVAALRRVKEAELGKLVVLREPAGYVTSLVGSDKPIFAWLAQSLGGPMDCRGIPNQTFYVADCCLTPISEMSEAEVRTVIETQAKTTQDEAMADLRQIFATREISEVELDAAIEKAALQSFIQFALEIVATPVALREIGFRPEIADGDSLAWTGVHEGTEFKAFGGPDWFDAWHMIYTAVTPRAALCHESVLTAEGPRGAVFLSVLTAWRSIFPKASVPNCLELGVIYEQHLESLRILKLGVPHLSVDPKVFRATMKWLREIRLDPQLHDVLMLTFSDDLLRLSVPGKTYAVPAWGYWALGCEVLLADLMAVPPNVFRCRRIQLEQAPDKLLINGYPLDARQLESEANVT